MVEKMRFRVVRSDHQEVTLDWNETVDLIESGQWMSIQVLEDESYTFEKNE
jgi:hypothetical protein